MNYLCYFNRIKLFESWVFEFDSRTVANQCKRSPPHPWSEMKLCIFWNDKVSCECWQGKAVHITKVTSMHLQFPMSLWTRKRNWKVAQTFLLSDGICEYQRSQRLPFHSTILVDKFLCPDLWKLLRVKYKRFLESSIQHQMDRLAYFSPPTCL